MYLYLVLSDIHKKHLCPFLSYFRSKSASKAWDQTSKFMKDMKELLLEKVFVVNVLGAALVKSLGFFGTFMLEVAGELMDFVPQS